MSHHLALLVGINDYSGAKGVDDLQGAVADINAFEAWLKQKPYLAEKVTIKKVGHAKSRAAKRKSIINAVNQIDDHASRYKREHGVRLKRLYLYFAGHGFINKGWESEYFRENAFCPADWDEDIAGDCIPVVQLGYYLSRRDIFDEVFVFADACRDVMSLVVEMPRLPLSRKRRKNSETKLILALAAKPEQVAREDHYDLSNEHRGAFSLALLNALETAPRNQNGELDYLSWKRAVITRVKELLNPGEIQTPEIKPDFDGELCVISDKPASPSILSVKSRSGTVYDRIELHFKEQQVAIANDTSEARLEVPAMKVYVLKTFLAGQEIREIPVEVQLGGSSVEIK